MDYLFMGGEYWAIVCSFHKHINIYKSGMDRACCLFLHWILHFGIYVALFIIAGTGVGVMDRPPECPTFKEGAQCRLLD